MAIALLTNTIATGVALVALIFTFGPIFGAHFNPAAALVDAMEGGLSWREAAGYVAAQCSGAVAGAIAAHLMFGFPLVSVSGHVRSGSAQALSEFVATFGLLCVIWGCSRSRSQIVPFAAGAYIAAAYWFAASTSFATPAVTIGRSLSDTFSGIRPMDVPLSSSRNLLALSLRRCCFAGSRRACVPRPAQCWSRKIEGDITAQLKIFASP